MTAKRFTIVYNEQSKMIQYVDTQKEEPNRWAIWNIKETLQMMNDFAEENEQLKQSYTKLKHRHSLLYDECLDAECDRDSYQKDVSSLEKENEQLKEEIKDLNEFKMSIYEIAKASDHYKERIKKLKRS